MVVNQEGNEWFVLEKGLVMAGPFDTNAAAWRWIDRQSGSPISRSEDVAEWIWNKSADQ